MKKVRFKKTATAKQFTAKRRSRTNSLARRYQEICALRRKLELAESEPDRAK
jgi:hypothetical protein